MGMQNNSDSLLPFQTKIEGIFTLILLRVVVTFTFFDDRSILKARQFRFVYLKISSFILIHGRNVHMFPFDEAL